MSQKSFILASLRCFKTLQRSVKKVLDLIFISIKIKNPETKCSCKVESNEIIRCLDMINCNDF